MTISEALGLRTEDLDFTSKRVSLHEEGGRLLKRKSRQREIALTDSVIELLQETLEGRECDEDTRVFPVTYSPARKAWIRTCKAAGIKGATIHDSRHTFAVHAVQQGVPEARLQKLLGHSHFGTTRRYATHAPEQFVAADVDRVSKSMGLTDLSDRNLVVAVCSNPTADRRGSFERTASEAGSSIPDQRSLWASFE
jgi:integrase